MKAAGGTVSQKRSPQPAIDQVVDKLRAVSPEQSAEAVSPEQAGEDDDRQLTRAFMLMSPPVLNAIWDNPDDAEVRSVVKRPEAQHVTERLSALGRTT